MHAEKNHYIVVGEKLNTEICKQVTVSLVRSIVSVDSDCSWSASPALIIFIHHKHGSSKNNKYN